MAADPCDLTTTAAVKSYLSITDASDDVLLQMLVTAASRRIATEIAGDQGNILRQPYTDVVNGNGGASLHLANRPVVSVSSVTINGVSVPQIQNTGDNGWILTNDRIQLVGYVFGDPTAIGSGYGWGYDYSRPGVANVSVSYVAGYDPAALPADLSFACIELVGWMYRGKEHIGIAQRTVGGEPTQYQGTWATEQSAGGLPASVAAVCRVYKPPRV